MPRPPLPLALTAALLLVGCEPKTAPAPTPIPASPATPAAEPPTVMAPAGQNEPEPTLAGENGGGENAQNSGSIVGRTTREVVNARELTTDPEWVVIEPEVSGSDPLSVAGTAYGRASTFAGSLGIVQWIKTEKALNGRPPTFPEMQKFLADNPRLELPAVKDYWRYGYDDSTGEFVVLENKAQKAARYRELGLPPE